MLACSIDQPVFLADLGHFRRPEIADGFTVRRPRRCFPIGKYKPLMRPVLKIRAE